MGWVYVLINPSMPEIYKVGMTDRTPEERAKELSSSTSVATPFLVIYKQRTDYPKQLEYEVHKELEKSNSRVNQNREFFNGDPSVAIRAIVRLSDELNLSDANAQERTDGDPWHDFEKEAFEYLTGQGNKLEDRIKATELFRTAEKLGSKRSSIELIKLEDDDGWIKSDNSVKKLSELRNLGELEASYILLKHYDALGVVSNSVKLAKEILASRNTINEDVVGECVFYLARIAIKRCSAYGYENILSEITKEKSESIIHFLGDFQDVLVAFYTRRLEILTRDSTRLDLMVTVIPDLGILSTLGRIYSNQQLEKLGYHLTKDEIIEIQNDDWCDRAQAICDDLLDENEKVDIPGNYTEFKTLNHGCVYQIRYGQGEFLKHSFLDKRFGHGVPVEFYFLRVNGLFTFRKSIRYEGEKFLKVNQAILTNSSKRDIKWPCHDNGTEHLGPARYRLSKYYETYDTPFDETEVEIVKSILGGEKVLLQLFGDNGQMNFEINKTAALALLEMVEFHEHFSDNQSI